MRLHHHPPARQPGMWGGRVRRWLGWAARCNAGLRVWAAHHLGRPCSSCANYKSGSEGSRTPCRARRADRWLRGSPEQTACCCFLHGASLGMVGSSGSRGSSSPAVPPLPASSDLAVGSCPKAPCVPRVRRAAGRHRTSANHPNCRLGVHAACGNSKQPAQPLQQQKQVAVAPRVNALQPAAPARWPSPLRPPRPPRN